MMRIAVAVISLLLGICYAVEDSQLVGCFLSSHLDTADKTLVRPLTWEICAHLCSSQATRWFGVQASHHLCYCINDPIMITTSQITNDCVPCLDNIKRYCGADNSLSVYELTEHHSDVLLVATPSGVMFLKGMALSAIGGLYESATAVDFHYKKLSIFYLNKNKLFRSTYVPHLMEYYSPTTIYETSHDITDFAVNWLEEMIYMNYLNAFFNMRLNGTGTEKIISMTRTTENMALDPYTRIFFAKLSTNLMSYNFSNLNADMVGKFKFKVIKSVAIDLHQEWVYVIGTYDSYSAWYIAAVDYNCTYFRVLYGGRGLTDPFSLEVLDGQLYWVDRNKTHHTVYKGVISSQGHMQTVTVIYDGTQKINRIKIFHPDAQTPSKTYLCKLKNCSQECVALSYRLAKCTCSPDMVLAEDGVTCDDNKIIPTTTEPDSTDVWSHALISNPVDKSPMTENTSASDLFSKTSIEDQTRATPLPVDHRLVSSSPTLPLILICNLVVICFLLLIAIIVIRQQIQLKNIKVFYNTSYDIAKLTIDD